MSIVQIQFTHGLADGEMGLSVDDIVYSYYGKRSGSVIEAKLNGSMQLMAPDEDRLKIINWVHKGADEKAFYDTGIRKIMDNNCIMCHNASSGLPIPDFTKFENVAKRADTDTGASFSSLARVSHIHLFGISFIFIRAIFLTSFFVFKFCSNIHILLDVMQIDLLHIIDENKLV